MANEDYVYWSLQFPFFNGSEWVMINQVGIELKFETKEEALAKKAETLRAIIRMYDL